MRMSKTSSNTTFNFEDNNIKALLSDIRFNTESHNDKEGKLSTIKNLFVITLIKI